MFTTNRFRTTGLITGILATISLLVLPALASAETSAHRIKRKLHKVEHRTGVVAKKTATVVAVGLVVVALEVVLGLGDDDADGFGSVQSKVSRARPENPPRSHGGKPAAPAHHVK